MFLFVRWEDVSLTISVRSIQDYSNHIRRGFCRSCIWETLSRSGCSGWRGEDETNPSVSRWITSQIDNKKYRQDLWRGKIVKYISFIWLFLYNYINIFFKWLLERRDGRLEYAPSTKSQERICHTFRGRMRRLLGNRLEWMPNRFTWTPLRICSTLWRWETRLCRKHWTPDKRISGCNDLLSNPRIEKLRNRAPTPTRSFFIFFRFVL